MTISLPRRKNARNNFLDFILNFQDFKYLLKTLFLLFFFISLLLLLLYILSSQDRVITSTNKNEFLLEIPNNNTLLYIMRINVLQYVSAVLL